MGLAVVIFFFVPWLDHGKVKSIRYRGALYKGFLAAFVVSFVILSICGLFPTNVWGQFGPLLGGAEVATVVARVFTVIYFAFFLLMPIYTKLDKTKPEPERIVW
jgi:ubiquinol-cytochrome c reductase cytochrome b subunit